MCHERLVKECVRFKDIYDIKHRSRVILEEGYCRTSTRGLKLITDGFYASPVKTTF